MANEDTSGIENRINSELDYYAVLQCNQNSTLEELKQSYRNLIKKFHPDKQSQTGSSGSEQLFILIDKAYKTLSDTKLRKEYDAQLTENNFNENSLIYAELNKSDLKFVDEVCYFPCRCGQNIEISADVLQEEECLVECSECTNCILIK
ncbi:dnaJ homolog subfamily C member 24-like [Diabrotica virgifera virgifera]|uniref:Diphthamide biosynthesis protein 4 n=1 Tax=Diabrotica virgifera virgifera TaxID=50390 RepID=A0ABM5K729_DIAVI|nr:dnaJ homolog subfamily C member 24-like [Diabrotica virgifera virgifera]